MNDMALTLLSNLHPNPSMHVREDVTKKRM